MMRPLLRILCLFLLASTAAHATDTITGPARVIDGDTIEIEGEKIRLKGIDAPEMGQPCHSGGDCGERAAMALENIIAFHANRGRYVSCTTEGRDRYRRILASCTAGERDLGGYMMGLGLAVPYRYDFEAPWLYRQKR